MTNFAGYPSLNNVFDLASADLNGDGILDLVMAEDLYTKGLDVFFGQSDGGLDGPTRYPGATDGFVGVGDINGDGFPDIVVSQTWGLVGYGEQLGIFLNDGKGGFTFLTSIVVFYQAATIQIGDLNGDGLGDLVVGAWGVLDDGGRETGGVEIFMNEGAGNFSAGTLLNGVSSSAYGEPAVADLNGDGLADIVAASPDQARVAVLLNSADGGFNTSLYPVADGGISVVAVTSGSYPDLFVGSPGRFDLLKNSGQGTFTAGGFQDVPTQYPQFIVVGDFNGDCIRDVAIMEEEIATCVDRNIYVSLGDGDGGFASPLTLQSPAVGQKGLAALGSVSSPSALAVGGQCGAAGGGGDGGGVTVYGDATP